MGNVNGNFVVFALAILVLFGFGSLFVIDLHGLVHRWGPWREPEPQVRIHWWPTARSRTYAGSWEQMRYCTRCNRIQTRTVRGMTNEEMKTFMELEDVQWGLSRGPLHG